MSLATRCSACATVFRVVQDQLKVSEGWVRCGRCDTVFNALEQLFDIDREPLPADATTGRRTPHAELPELASEADPKPPMADAFGALLRQRSALLPPLDAPPAAQHADPMRAEPRLDARTQHEHHALLQDVPGGAEPEPEPFLADAGPDFIRQPSDEPEGADSSAPPEFMRRAERSARWQRAPVRWALRAASGVLLITFALQAAHHFRDGLVARWPSTAPLAKAWCGAIGCRIEPPRRIGDLTVENTALVPAGAGPGTFSLAVTLRNRGRLALALPSVDLTLTDSNGQLVARRSLAASEFSLSDAKNDVKAGNPGNSAGADRPALLQPDVDTRFQATLATAPRVVGYSIELFYP